MQNIVKSKANIQHMNFPVSMSAIKNFKNPLGSTSFYDNTNRKSLVSDYFKNNLKIQTND